VKDSWRLWHCQTVAWNVLATHCSEICAPVAEQWPKWTPRIEGATWSAWRIPTAVFSAF
jgi:hypothetical protein